MPALQGSLGYLHTRFESFPNAINDITGQQLDRTGQSFNESPSLQTFLSVQYSLPLNIGQAPWLKGWLTPRIQWSYRSGMHLLGPEVAQALQTGYNLLGARLSYDFLDARAQVALWGENLADQQYKGIANTALASSFGILGTAYPIGRTWGGELTYRF